MMKIKLPWQTISHQRRITFYQGQYGHLLLLRNKKRKWRWSLLPYPCRKRRRSKNMHSVYIYNTLPVVHVKRVASFRHLEVSSCFLTAIGTNLPTKTLHKIPPPSQTLNYNPILNSPKYLIIHICIFPNHYHWFPLFSSRSYQRWEK